MTGGHGIGRACSHIKALWLSHAREKTDQNTEGLQIRHPISLCSASTMFMLIEHKKKIIIIIPILTFIRFSGKAHHILH